MKKLLGALAVAALAAPIGTALAADLRVPVKAPVMAPVAGLQLDRLLCRRERRLQLGPDPMSISARLA